jgi:hypothetical protein
LDFGCIPALLKEEGSTLREMGALLPWGEGGKKWGSQISSLLSRKRPGEEVLQYFGLCDLCVKDIESRMDRDSISLSRAIGLWVPA